MSIMSKSDFPPAYEDALHGPRPRHGNYPQPPPGYGPYPAQSSAQYPGQAGYPLGYPPSGMPYSIPLGMPTSNPVEDNEFPYSTAWESISIRHAFIRKVYLILAAQLIVTVSIVAVFTFVEEVRAFVIRNPAVYWTSFAVYLVTYCILVCCEGPRRRFPWNFVLLAIFTLAMSYMTGTISSYYDTKAVLLTIGITAIVCIIVTIFCFQTKVDFTSCGGLFSILAIVVLVTGIITAIVLSFKYIPWLHMLYAAIGAVIYTLFLAYNTQLLIGNRKLSISPEEYVFGALSLYVDIVQIFIFLLQLVGASTD
ncbi:protein lifeguard 3 [Oncorhynchus tshawytscha]|nr:protein lifeguard 3 [Oncorhynchus tshawytscha]XP_024259673.1 protein lifeguard 3 [Oncorhynchus tshawytscha]